MITNLLFILLLSGVAVFARGQFSGKGDARGVRVLRRDLVTWRGKVHGLDPDEDGPEAPGKKKAMRLGSVSGFTFGGKLRLEVVRIGDDEEIYATAQYARVKPKKVLVVVDVPESPYE